MASSQEEILDVSDSEWETYKKDFEKTYADQAVEQTHRQIYIASKRKVADHNKKYESGEVTWKMGINQFSDMTEEQRKCYHGLRTDKK